MADEDIPQIETASDAVEDNTIRPYIRCEFAGELSADMSISMDAVSPTMLWGAARVIEQYATDLWYQNQLQQQQEAALAAQQQERPSGLVAVRGALTADHLPKRNH